MNTLRTAPLSPRLRARRRRADRRDNGAHRRCPQRSLPRLPPRPRSRRARRAGGDRGHDRAGEHRRHRPAGREHRARSENRASPQLDAPLRSSAAAGSPSPAVVAIRRAGRTTSGPSPFGHRANAFRGSNPQAPAARPRRVPLRSPFRGFVAWPLRDARGFPRMRSTPGNETGSATRRPAESGTGTARIQASDPPQPGVHHEPLRTLELPPRLRRRRRGTVRCHARDRRRAARRTRRRLRGGRTREPQRRRRPTSRSSGPDRCRCPVPVRAVVLEPVNVVGRRARPCAPDRDIPPCGPRCSPGDGLRKGRASARPFIFQERSDPHRLHESARTAGLPAPDPRGGRRPSQHGRVDARGRKRAPLPTAARAPSGRPALVAAAVSRGSGLPPV